MAVVERTFRDQPLREIGAALRGAIEAGERAALEAMLAELGDLTDAAVESADVRRIARERDRLHRIARALDDLAARPPASYALGYLADADRRLDRARTRTLGTLAAERREREAATVRERVLAALATPRRPGDVAAELRCDPSQVSRALRELAADGLVVRVAPPELAPGDRRAHWYARAQLDVHAA